MQIMWVLACLRDGVVLRDTLLRVLWGKNSVETARNNSTCRDRSWDEPYCSPLVHRSPTRPDNSANDEERSSFGWFGPAFRSIPTLCLHRHRPLRLFTEHEAAARSARFLKGGTCLR